MKELEGKEVYLRPTGNHAKRYGDVCKKATIVKVGRVFVTFKLEGSTIEDKYRFEGRSLRNDFNSGYVVYADEKELNEYFELNNIAKRIYKKYKYSHDFMEVDLVKLRQVAELLDV